MIQTLWRHWTRPKRLDTIAYFGLGLLGLHQIQQHVGTIEPMYGPSMYPTVLGQGELCLYRKLSAKQRLSVKRGELITFISPLEPNRLICKRVLGLGGDTIVVDPTHAQLSDVHCRIPQGHIWVQGDNAGLSRDSREYGPIPLALVKGRVVCQIWPFKTFPNPFES